MTALRVDHATIAGSALDPLREAFAGAGLETDYGGPHSNGVTHMALLGFEDGSYLELISTLEPGAESPWWGAHIAGDAGPCAWAVEVADVAAEAARLQAAGVPVDGPAHFLRERPDGVVVEWDLAFVGDPGGGALLPFVLRDRTPRAQRVPLSASVAGSGITGVATVVLGVETPERGVDAFRTAHGLEPPGWSDDEHFGARLAAYPGQPFVLAAPRAADGWLRARLDRLGPAPCAILLGSAALERSRERLGLAEPVRFCGRRVAWASRGPLAGLGIGVVEV